MEQSILTSTKKMLNVAPDDDSFDLDVITHINSAFSVLHDLGVGVEEGFAIEDASSVWDDFLPADQDLVQQSQVKTFVFIRARLSFDPPNSSYLLTALEKLLDETTSRISMRRENVEWVSPLPLPVPEEDIYDIDGGFAI